MAVETVDLCGAEAGDKGAGKGNQDHADDRRDFLGQQQGDDDNNYGEANQGEHMYFFSCGEGNGACLSREAAGWLRVTRTGLGRW